MGSRLLLTYMQHVKVQISGAPQGIAVEHLLPSNLEEGATGDVTRYSGTGRAWHATKSSRAPFQSYALRSLTLFFPNNKFTSMPTPGYYFRDGGATPPAEEDPHNEFRRRITTATTAAPTQKKSIAATHGPLAQETSESHKLATDNAQDIGGAVQRAGQERGITNLGESII